MLCTLTPMASRPRTWRNCVTSLGSYEPSRQSGQRETGSQYLLKSKTVLRHRVASEQCSFRIRLGPLHLTYYRGRSLSLVACESEVPEAGRCSHGGWRLQP